MFKTATRVRFYVCSVLMLLFGTVGNGYYANLLFGHFDIAFTVMAQVLLKLLPLWLPSFVLLNLICLAWNSLAVRIPSIRAVCDRRFFVAMNCIVMLLSVDIFFAVVSVKIETFGQ